MFKHDDLSNNTLKYENISSITSGVVRWFGYLVNINRLKP
jgi:hypothetical protein